MPHKNLYHRRLVDQANAKACWVCYRPATNVLITPESDDWFHICPAHLTDRHFATPKDAEDIAKKKREQELEAEKQLVIKEYNEKIQKRLAKRKEKDGKDKSKDKKADDKAQDEQDEKEKQDKLAEIEKKQEDSSQAVDEGPPIFELSKNFFNMRLQKKQDIEIAKRDRARLKNPNFFPTVPTGKP